MNLDTALTLFTTASISAGLAKDVERMLREGDTSGSLAKELELIEVGEFWEMMFFRTPVTIVSYTGKTADDTVTFLRRGEEGTLPLPLFLGSNIHPSLKENKDDEEAETTQTEPTEQDETPDDSNETKPETFGFKKARKLMMQGRWVTRLCSDDNPITLAGDNSIVSSVGAETQVCLTGDDITASDWIEVEI